MSPFLFSKNSSLFIFLWFIFSHFAQLICKRTLMTTFLQKGVDEFGAYQHNTPRTSDGDTLKRDGYVAQLVRAHHS